MVLPNDPNRISIQPNMKLDGSSVFLANNSSAIRLPTPGITCCGNGGYMSTNNKSAETDEFNQTEDLLAAEISKLSFQERNKAHEDVHCVGEELKEDPTVVEESLLAFQQEVDVLRPKTQVYQSAEAINADYVNGRGFRLKFLRASLYDVKKAVHQMIRFLQCKEKYFGRDKLCKDIDSSDLTEEDRVFMRTGAFLVLKNRDRSGRPVVFFLNTKLPLGTAANMIRVGHCIWWNLLRYEQVQLKGLVGVYYDIQKPDEQPKLLKVKDAVEIMNFTLSLPFRYSSCLWCLKTGKMSSVLNNSIVGVATRYFSNYIRVRTRLHYGSDLELHYHLKSHGIELHDFPVDTDGNVLQDVIDRWTQEELEKSKKSPESNAAIRHRTNSVTTMGSIDNNTLPSAPRLKPNPVLMVQQPPATVAPSLAIEPRPQDVLFGRGVGCQNHPGNIRFREIMMSYKEQYNNVPRSKRRVIMSTLRLALQASGTRFLRYNKDNIWEECNAAEVDTKIGQFFRSLRKHKKQEK